MSHTAVVACVGVQKRHFHSQGYSKGYGVENGRKLERSAYCES